MTHIQCILLFCQEFIISVFLKYVVETNKKFPWTAIFLFNRKSISCQSSPSKWLRTTFLCAGSKNNKVHKVRRKAVDNGRHKRSEIWMLCGMTWVPSDIFISIWATKKGKEMIRLRRVQGDLYKNLDLTVHWKIIFSEGMCRFLF